MAQWQARDWPGNVRELRNFADRLVLGVIEESMHTSFTAEKVDAGNLPQQVDAYERMLIAEALAASENSVAAAADALGVPKKTLYDKLKKYQLTAGRAAE